MSVMRQQIAPGSLYGPSGSQLGPHRSAPGLGGLPGGVVGPEAAGLDPSGPEHFFVTLAAYADALDALPLDLTRSFSDLRELDAVLGSHLNSLTARLHHLTALIEDPEIDQGQRLLALKEVAEEARAYKMGGEDKIRVALNTAETIISHTDYIDALVDQLDHFPEISQLLNPKKHLNLDQYYARGGGLKNRELLAALDGSLALANAASAAEQGGSKKKKVSANLASGSGASKSHKTLGESMSITSSAAGIPATSTAASSSSKKRKANPVAATTGSAGSATSSKVARTGSSMGRVDEDVKAATNGVSHKKKVVDHSNGSRSAQQINSNTRLPRAAHAQGIYAEDEDDGAARNAARRAGGLADTDDGGRSRSSRPARGAHRSDDDEEDDDGEADEDDDSPHGLAAKSRARMGRAGVATGTSRGRATGTMAANSPHMGGSASASRADSPASNEGAGGDDADEARYCFCNNVSYGDMIGCDDDDCEREWFHLGCVGLTKPPQGTWYCEACLERRAGNGRAKAKKSKVASSTSSSSSKNKTRR